MKATERRAWLLERLKGEENPVSASALAREAGVSRQIIVGDIAVLRAGDCNIYATPRGYLLEREKKVGTLFTIACRHTAEQMREELETVVRLGGGVLDVKVEHPLYGEISGNLQIHTQEDVEDFLNKLQQYRAEPLCHLTEGVHLHTISCPDRETYEQICQNLRKKGLLAEK